MAAAVFGLSEVRFFIIGLLLLFYFTSNFDLYGGGGGGSLVEGIMRNNPVKLF